MLIQELERLFTCIADYPSLHARSSPFWVTNANGSLEEFTVVTCDMLEVFCAVGFVKIDAEGHEAVLIRRVPLNRWSTLDAIVEIGSAESAREIWNHLSDNRSGVNVFCQKLGWNIARSLDDLPTSYRDDSVFISTKTTMPWDVPFG